MEHAPGHEIVHSYSLRPSQSSIDRALEFKISQAASTAFLATAIYSFPKRVDPAFRLGAWGNLLISALHHGFMVQTRPPHRLRIFGRSCSWACSGVDDRRPLLRALTSIDQAVVGYICLYTGCAGLWIPHMPASIFTACLLLARVAGNAGIGIVILVSLYLTVPQVMTNRSARERTNS